ncbi:dehydrogenase/reductase SDR family member 7-like protein [Dinothrombium tinctorium]|uniref:Dehydrogenase/reductase SDR family member 7-like protein n=1 Tax=Dinothrombium tinctorium TaxID=1965070 RepID=A0A3S3P168_9ACAR|nr:dehydrogenase/reductase SDR family member 7-like protein [Dinothrombium tinctorium]
MNIATFDEFDIKVDRELFEINVFGLVNLTRIVLRHWYENNYNGHIVINSSILGKFGVPIFSTYAASKHALHGYFEALRLESYFRGIHVTMVCAGPVFSNIVKNSFSGKHGEAFGGEHKLFEKSMATRRCANLMAIAIANQLEEVCVSIQPSLALVYCMQYIPQISRQIMCKFATKERLRTFRD